MDIAVIQKQCEAFLKQINVPGFIVLGFQSDPQNVQMVYSMKEMPPVAVVKGVAKVLEEVAGKM